MNLRKGREAKNKEQSVEEPYTYEIRVRGRLGETWAHWFEGMKIIHKDKVTILSGEVVDQAALRGILSKIWDLNLTVISVYQVEKKSTRNY